jgi:hypothetical protein
VVKRKAKKGKQKQGESTTEASQPTHPDGIPGVQAAGKPDAVNGPGEFHPVRGEAAAEAGPPEEMVASPGMEEARQWEQDDVAPVNVSPKYDMDGDEFRDVWGSGQPSGGQEHI